MSALSNYLENKVLDFLFRGVAFTPPTTYYFALFTVAPTDAGGGTEVSGSNYARVTVAASLANFSGTQGTQTTTNSSGTSGTVYNNIPLTFPAPTGGNWGLIVGMGVFDALTGGNLICYGAVSPNKTVNNGDAPPQYNADTWSLQLDND